jgi:hypothetical protein
MHSVAGFKRIMLFDKSWTSGSKGNLLVFQMREEANLVISGKTLEDHKKRQFPLMTNFKAEIPTLETGRPLLLNLLTHARQGGVCAEIVGQKKSSSTYDGVFQFVGNSFLGIDFEYESSLARRGAKIMLEASFDQIDAKAILEAAQINAMYDDTPDVFPYDKFESPKFESLKFGDSPGTSLVNKEDIISLSLIVKSTGNKSLYDRTMVNDVEVNFDIVIADASKEKILSVFNIAPWAPRLEFKQKIGDGAASETHLFDEGVLGLTSKPELADAKRDLTLNFTGKIPLWDIAYSGTTPNQIYTYSA